MTLRYPYMLLLLGVSFVFGCESTPKMTPDASDALAMLAVRQIKIQPFTRIKSFDDDKVPDGIAVVILPTDRFGDPVKAVGHFYFELYEYRNASGDREGKRIEFWDRTIATADDVKLYWDRTSQMYVFPLAWTAGIPAMKNDKLILHVTLRTPWDETLEDERVLSLQPSRGWLGESESSGG